MKGAFSMNNKKIEVLSPDLDGLFDPAEEVEVRIREKERFTPDIIRDIAHFLLSVADYYDHKKKEN